MRIQSPTYQSTIFLGLREGYGKIIHSFQEVKEYLVGYCTVFPFCVTITPTHFCYRQGDEPGVIIGIINYPRFPKDFNQLDEYTLDIAERVRKEFKQYRVTVILPDNNTVTLEGDED